MKKLILLLFISFPFISFAQDLEDGEVPSPVMSKFKKMYSLTDEVDWKKKGENYIAELDIHEKEVNIIFDSKGNLIQKEMELEESEIPKPTLEYFHSKYLIKKEGEPITQAEVGNKTVLESIDAYKITDPKGLATYKIDAITSDLLFDSKGNFIKEVEKERDEE